MAWEDGQIDASVVDIFGYHALQLGMPELDALASNRMPHRWLACDGAIPPHRRVALQCDFTALPFPSNSLDLVVLPHTLEWSADPHACLREVERVLVPEGRVVICGFNRWSLWGLRQWRVRCYRRLGLRSRFLPDTGELIGYWRMRDWLRLLGFDVELGRFGCYRPSVQNETWLQRWAFLDRLGPRFWPVLGAAYYLVAVKRVRGMRLLEPAWKSAQQRMHKPVSIANRTDGHSTY